MASTNAFYVMVFLFVFILASSVMTYTMGTFLSTVSVFVGNSPTSPIMTNGITTVNGIYSTAYSVLNDGIVVVAVIALAIDAWTSYYSPDRGQGLLNIMLIVAMPIIWLSLSVVLPYLGSLNTGSPSAPVAYNFFSSTYFIVIFEFFLMVSAILNFRHTGESAYSGGIGESVDIRFNASTR